MSLFTIFFHAIIIDEDVNQEKESRATGFIGKNSGITWMQSLEQEVEKIILDKQQQPEPLTSDLIQPHDNIAAKSYYSDIPEVTFPVQLYYYALLPIYNGDFFYNIYLDFAYASFL